MVSGLLQGKSRHFVDLLMGQTLQLVAVLAMRFGHP